MKNQENVQKAFHHSAYMPYDPNRRSIYVTYLGAPHISGVQAFEFTGWRDECDSWKKTCYIHAGLNPHPTCILKGPDALKFLSDHFVNSFANFKIGTCKHAIMCNEEGLVAASGALLRLGEDEFEGHGMWPVIEYPLKKGSYNVECLNTTPSVFNFQLGGPRSLEILEAATGDDLHDIKFVHHRKSSIDGKPVRVLRLGMAGTLAYEVHGQLEDAIPIYNAIMKAGEPFEIRKLGLRAYIMTHYENGFPQFSLDFPWAPIDKDFGPFQKDIGKVIDLFGTDVKFTGSMGPDVRLRWRNPVELGWTGMVKFDHEFVGRAALEKEAANPHRKMVTLEWDTEDVVDVYRSQFQPGEPYAYMDEPEDFTELIFSSGVYEYHADQVIKDGKIVGISSGRMNSFTYHKMISLCSIDTEFSELGTEVTVLWGEPGARQKEIKAIVSRYPYLDEERNENVDVSKIPHLASNR